MRNTLAQRKSRTQSKVVTGQDLPNGGMFGDDKAWGGLFDLILTNDPIAKQIEEWLGMKGATDKLFEDRSNLRKDALGMKKYDDHAVTVAPSGAGAQGMQQALRQLMNPKAKMSPNRRTMAGAGVGRRQMRF